MIVNLSFMWFMQYEINIYEDHNQSFEHEFIEHTFYVAMTALKVYLFDVNKMYNVQRKIEYYLD